MKSDVQSGAGVPASKAEAPATPATEVEGVLERAVAGERPERVFRVNRRLVVLLAEFAPWDGTVVDVPMEVVFSLVRDELEEVHREGCFEDWGKPLNWYSSLDYVLNPWVFMYLKVHQMLAQIIKHTAATPTLKRTNAYETISLCSSVYHVDFDQPGADYDSRGSTNSTISTKSTELLPPQRRQKDGEHSADEILVRADDLAAQLWANQDAYVYVAPGLWAAAAPTAQPATSHAIIIPIDEGHLSMAVTSCGRFDAYFLASVAEYLSPLIEANPELLAYPKILLGSKAMCVSRAAHARRVYRDATQTHVVDASKFAWYHTLLTSGSLKAVQDTFVDFATEIWHTQFNRFDEENLQRLETLMIALLGHRHDMVRSQASVCLNNLIDRHDWQCEIPFLPVVKYVGDSFTIEVVIEQTVAGPPEDVFLIVSGPSASRTAEVYTYHTLEWISNDAISTPSLLPATSLGGLGKRHHWKGVCDLGNFSRAGFFDWRLVRADPSSGSWRPLHASVESLRRTCTGSFSLATLENSQDATTLEFKSRNLWPELGRLKEVQEATGHSVFKTLPLQGRFLVQPNDARSLSLHEINVDLYGAKYSGERISERGSFSKIRENLAKFREVGITALCLTGCQARDNGGVSYKRAGGEPEYEYPDASPYAITDRASICEVVGGRSKFDELIREANRNNIRVIVDTQTRIATSGFHRKYRGRELQYMEPNAGSGRCRVLDKGQSRFYIEDESFELDYRERETWYLFIEDVCEWISTNRVDGVRIDSAFLLPRIFPPDEKELMRLDSDGQYHYSTLERLRAKVVEPQQKDCGYWSSTAASGHWPNPFIVMTCREIWRRAPNCLVLGDCGLLPDAESRRLGVLSRSGMIPFVQNLPQILLRIFGKRYDETDQSIKECPPEEPAPVIASWYEATHESLPEGGVLVQASTSTASPLPPLLYNKGAWPAADLLFLSSDVPCTTMGEDEGQCLRRGVANVSPQSSEGLVPKPASSADMYRTDSSSVFTRARSLAKFESPHEVDKLESEYLKSFGVDTGHDIRKISEHYKHRREFRARYPIFGSSPMLPVNCYDVNGNTLNRVFGSCRIDDKSNVVIVITNFSQEPIDHVEVKISFLSKLISSRSPSSASLVEHWDLFAVPEANFDNDSYVKKFVSDGYTEPIKDGRIGLMTLPEFLSHRHKLSVEGYQSAGIGFKILDSNAADDEQLALCLTISSLNRLRLLGKQKADTADRKIAIQSNYIIQSLTTTSRPEDNVNDLGEALRDLARAMLWLRELDGANATATETSPKDVARLLYDVDFISHNKGLTAKLFAKVHKIVEGITDTEPESVLMGEICKELLALEDIGPIVFVTSELGKWSTVGGLGVMIDELSLTLSNDLGYDCIVMSPYYHWNRKGETDYLKRDGIEWQFNVDVKIGPETLTFGVHAGVHRNVRLVFVHNEAIFHHPYPDSSAKDAVRLLTTFGKVFLETLCALKVFPQVLVTNDWATGLIPAYAKKGFFGDVFMDTTFFHIVHNFDPAYEGRVYPPAGESYGWIHDLPRDDLIDPLWTTPIINPSRCVLLNCDQWGTVSCSYRDDLVGWNGCSASSPLAYLLNRFPQPYATANGVPVGVRRQKIEALSFKGHLECKAELQRKYFHFEKPDLTIPMFAFIGRVTTQKGVHLILEAAESIINRYNNRVQILVGGPVTWKDPYSARCGHMMNHLRGKYPWSFYAAPNEFFTDGTLVNVGADFGLMPSLFEPGGIVQQEFFMGGTPVIAFRTGGLKDTVHEFDVEKNDVGNGFTFSAYNLGDFMYAFERAMRVFADQTKYNKLRENSEKSVVSCEQCALGWMGEFCRLRRKIMLNPKDVQQMKQRLPNYNPRAQRERKPVAAIVAKIRAAKSSAPPSTNIAAGPEVVQLRLYTDATPRPRSVAVSGSFDDWSMRRPLTWDNSLTCFRLDLSLPRGKHLFKFVVDGVWMCSKHHQQLQDDNGNENNVIII